MINKAIVTTLSAAVLFSGGSLTSVEASASTSQSQDQSYNCYYSINGDSQQLSSDRFDSFINKYFSQINWDNGAVKQEQTEPTTVTDSEPKQPKADKQQRVEQPKGQQQTVEQTETDKQQQTVEQTKAPVQQQQAKQQEQQNKQTQSQLGEFEQQVVELTNKERTERGLDPLKVDVQLSEVAAMKSKDMAKNNYFSHNSPTYGSPFDMMKQFGITYKSAGENIAKGQRTPQEVVNGWMHSQGHRENILNPSFTHIGVGYVEQGNYWTQQFIGK